MEIILIRHGKSQKSNGGQVNTLISEKGIWQAEKLGEHVKKTKCKVSKLYTSPLSRALSTAKIIGSHIEQDPVIIKDAMERTYGDLDGLSDQEAMELYPDEHQQSEADPLYVPPNGESYEMVEERVKRVLQEFVFPESNDTIGIVSHGDWMNVFLHTLLDVDKELFPVFKVKNTSYSSIVVKPSTIKLKYLNRVDHLNTMK